MVAKVKCECGLYLIENNLNKHYNTNTHKSLIQIKNRKMNNYHDKKDTSNACVICFKTDIPNQYYIESIRRCMCCDEILLGGKRRCIECKVVKNITEFERPYLIRCRSCAKTRLMKKILCDICGKEFNLSHMSRHKKNKHTPKLDSDIIDL